MGRRMRGEEGRKKVVGGRHKAGHPPIAFSFRL
jgi:hypothetical protein